MHYALYLFSFAFVRILIVIVVVCVFVHVCVCICVCLGPDSQLPVIFTDPGILHIIIILIILMCSLFEFA